MSDSLPLSLIIPTYMRSAVLWKTVSDLRGQLREGDELLVVDQNRPPLQPPADLAGPWLRLCRLAVPSLTRARNLGIDLARHEHVVFLDDDIVPDGGLLERFRSAALEHPGCIVTGRVEQDDAPEDIPTPGTVDLDTGEIRTNFSRPVAGEIPFFPGGLFLAPKECLPSRPYFCPDFRGASQGEEIDFAMRARARGVRIHADPRIRIFHLKAVEGGCRSPEFRRRFFLDNVHNQSLFFGRHGSLLRLRGFLWRIKGFIGFHTRRTGGGHSPREVAAALGTLALGLAAGIGWRRK